MQHAQANPILTVLVPQLETPKVLFHLTQTRFTLAHQLQARQALTRLLVAELLLSLLFQAVGAQALPIRAVVVFLHLFENL